MSGKQPELPSRAALSRKLSDFREALVQVEQGGSSAGQSSRDLLGTLRTLAERAETALNRGQLVLANELIDNGTALLTALAERSPD